MNRVLFCAEEIGRPLPVHDERARHLLRILKVAPGSRVEIGVIDGAIGIATVVSISHDELALEFELRDEGGPPLLQLGCLLGHPRPIVLKRILRDLSAIGVSAIVVCGTELGERSYLNSKLWLAGAWRRCLIEGAAQAGATALPRLCSASSVGHGLRLLEEMQQTPPATCLFFDEDAHRSDDADVAFPARADAPLVYAIGSERGWTGHERGQFLDAGWRTVGLGPRVLRVETAAVAAAVMCVSALRAGGRQLDG